ncbi:piwi like RNA-mediated gene silencing protein aubergine isoform X2 [Leptinotarsa decemlineata]|uniref:piwi like RNA-mediated gene silencing protein aubergine isoform X2 n=1 Tax=Leptinotarsa decemlineata TaxID=7539 RepID=UPI003D3081A3
MEPRGRGRARGRARGAPQQGSQGPRPGPQGPRPGPQGPRPGSQGPQGPRPGPQGPQGPRPGPQGPRPGPQQVPPQQRPAPVLQGPWNRPTLPSQAPQQPTPTQWVRPPQPIPTPSAGRGSRLGAGDSSDVVPSVEQAGGHQGAGEGSLEQARGRGGGNGGVRGRTLRNEIIFTRPKSLNTKQGTSGKPVMLMSNYFQLMKAGKWGLFQYRVDFNPDVDHTGHRKRYMSTAMRGSGINGYLFDGTVMYTTQRIHPDPLEKLVDSDTGERFRITIRLVGDVAWGDYHYIQLFNIIIRKCLTFMKFQLVGRQYFDPTNRVAIPEFCLELWPGFVTSMRQHENDILLNSDLTFKVMRQDNVYDLMLECRSSNHRAEFQSKIIGSVVLTYYNNKTYKIDDVDFHTSPASTFPRRDGSSISFVEYYRTRYNINIQVLTQPMLVSRSKPREIRAGMPETVLLIPELCQLTGLTDRQRENFQLMRALADHTRVGPVGRIAKLREFSNRMQNCPEVIQELRNWDLNLAKDLIRFQGRSLQQETILGGGNAKYFSGQKADWTRDLRVSPMISPAEFKKFVVICPAKFKRGCQDFLYQLKRAASGMSWFIPEEKMMDIGDDRANSYLDGIENAIAKEKPSLIMCVVSNNSADRYAAIKKKCCVDRGLPSQVILAKNLTSKGAMSVATKVAIQLNCKIGGAPWSLNIPLSNLMVVGYDVCRDTANRGRSFAGMVASLDRNATRYFNHVSEHRLEEELSDNFAAFLALACNKYNEVNEVYPEKILIYRDGVGDGQLPYVIEHEVENIKKKLTETLYKNNDLKMAFVVVSKRINTRIFTDIGENPPSGTVVDDVITLPERYDFFIVSQCVRQGSVSPTSYNVIADTIGLSADRMQILTYKLCHMYYNWSGTVRVPAPCQYAHKLAFLTAQSLHRPAHNSLETVLYYL